MRKHRTITRHDVIMALWVSMGSFVLIEGLVISHEITQTHAETAFIIVVSWAKDFIKDIIDFIRYEL